MQVLRRDDDRDGRYHPQRDQTTTTEGGACVLFHPTHEHWHIDGSSRYELLDPTGRWSSGPARSASAFETPTGCPAPTAGPRVYEACARDRIQGISPGWGDLYDRDLDGQTLALPAGLPDGPYCLRMTADPFDCFSETDESQQRLT